MLNAYEMKISWQKIMKWNIAFAEKHTKG